MPETSANLSEVCLSCGLCCTGAIFSHAKLSDADKQILGEAGAIPKDGTYTGDRLHLPCTFLSGTACTIYERGRPEICGEYLCKLVREVENGKTTLDEAKQITAQARQLLDDTNQALPPGTNITTGAQALVDGDLPKGSTQQAALHGRLAYFALQALLDKRFRARDQKLIKVSQDQ